MWDGLHALLTIVQIVVGLAIGWFPCRFLGEILSRGEALLTGVIIFATTIGLAILGTKDLDEREILVSIAIGAAFGILMALKPPGERHPL